MIANNTITHNGGSGIYCSYSSPTIVNNTIAGNMALAGGGILVSGASSLPTIANTITAFNASGICSQQSAAMVLRYNCVFGNTGYDYSGIADPTGADGNISVNPRLADLAYGNAHIQPDSPCKDAGNNADAYGSLDIDAQPRIQPTGGTVDMGADESDGTLWPPAGPSVIVRVKPDGDDNHDGSSWELAKLTVQAGIDVASAEGGEVWVQAGTYYERITLHPYAHVYGGFAGNETERDERDWTAHVTILDGQLGGSVVTATVGHGVSTIDGFTITNGGGGFYGGGVHCDSASPTIANNTITANSANGGGGIYCNASSATIAANTIAGNTTVYSGGGIFVSGGSPTIANNAITGNSSPGSHGGGIYLAGNSSGAYPTVTNNMIASNASLDGGGIYCAYVAMIANNTITANSATTNGGGVFCRSDVTIANNAITGNSATADGGGIYCPQSSCQRIIINNAITENWTSSGSGGGIYCYTSGTIAGNTIAANVAAANGGGIYLLGSSTSPTIVNSTIIGNSASKGGGIYCYHSYSHSPMIANTIVAFNSSSGIYKQGSGTVVLRYNCAYGNTPYNYSTVPDPTGTNGNISADPLFVDKDSGNYRLASGSPCLDAGRNADVPADTPDLDGDGNTSEPLPFDLARTLRFMDDPATADCRWVPGTCGDAPIVDMGAYEYMLGATAWRSVRTHGAAGDLGITFDAAATGAAAGCEPRRDGVQRIEVEFNGDISALMTGTIVAEDLTHGGTIAATGQYTINGGMTLVIEFDGGLPDAACYRIDLAGHVAGLVGDSDCLVRVLAGDVNGAVAPYGDGSTNLADMAQLKLSNNAPLTGDNVRLDLNVDGMINLADMALAKLLNGRNATCP